MIWILFYYNSLPDMPEGCSLFSPDLLHRDFFKCNPYNTGHYKYPKFETLSYDEGCHCKEVNNFLNKSDTEKYAVFYTRHTMQDKNLKGKKSENKIVGYFKVGKTFSFEWSKAGQLLSNTEAHKNIIQRCKRKNNKLLRGFEASEYVLLSKEKCIPINYNSRGVPVSWGHSKIKNRVKESLLELKNKLTKNIATKYQEKTNRIMELFKTADGREELIGTCQTCNVKIECYWGKKSEQTQRETLEKLYAGKSKC